MDVYERIVADIFDCFDRRDFDELSEVEREDMADPDRAWTTVIDARFYFTRDQVEAILKLSGEEQDV